MVKKPKKKPLPKLIKELQEKYFNPYIRERDRIGDHFKCISCGQVKHVSSMQAGHFHAVGRSTALRFNEDNVHGECAHCNGCNQDHLIGYTLNLQIKIGPERFKNLQEEYEYFRINRKGWKRWELEELIEIYKKKLKEEKLIDKIPF
jgi:hypothetical protein